MPQKRSSALVGCIPRVHSSSSRMQFSFCPRLTWQPPPVPRCIDRADRGVSAEPRAQALPRGPLPGPACADRTHLPRQHAGHHDHLAIGQTAQAKPSLDYFVNREFHGFTHRRLRTVFFLLLRAQKKKQEKGTPASPGATGFPYFSTRAGRGKTRASPSNNSRVFFRPRLRGAAGQNGRRRRSPLARSRAPEKLPKRDLHYLSEASLQSPGSTEKWLVFR